MSVCIPCERAKAIQENKLPFLRQKAKQRAIQHNEYFVIYYDTEDKKYMVTSQAFAISEGYTIIEVITPYT